MPNKQLVQPSANEVARVVESRRHRRRIVRLGSWHLAEMIARGACTEVFAARPLRSAADAPCDYVIKKLRPDLVDDPLARESIEREAHVGGCVSHPHLISILADHSKKTPYYVVMPRLEGATVRQALNGVGPMTVPQALWVGRQISEALEALHGVDLVHCDVKPANIFVAVTGHATLFDLGFTTKASASNPITRPKTAPAGLRGTLSYLAPEMLTSSTAAGPWSDTYSLGVTLFEMLTGRLPFSHTDPARMAEAHLRDVPPSARTHLPHLPRAVAQLIDRMLAKNPLRRPDDVTDQLRRLEIETFSLRPA